MKHSRRLGGPGCFPAAALGLLIFLSISPFSALAKPNPNELRDDTLAAWSEYVRSASLHAEARARGSPFLEITQSPERFLQVKAGLIPVWREKHPTAVPHGLIHDWLGAVFIREATLADVFAVTRNYGRYAETYSPTVVEAKRLSSAGDEDRYSMLLMQRTLFVTAAVQGEYEARYFRVDARRWYSVSQSTRLQALQNFGEPDMRTLPPDRGPGYVWRLYSFASFEETDGGIYIEMEALALSREVPAALRWLIDPVVERLSSNTVHAALEETRNAVLTRVTETKRPD